MVADDVSVYTDTQGLIAEISIDANDGIQGIVGWQNIKYDNQNLIFLHKAYFCFLRNKFFFLNSI